MNEPSHKNGFALPMTIIAVAGLLLLLIGLLTVLTLERKTARSYSDAARADLAVESGLAHALGLLTEVSARDDSLVFRLDDPAQPQVASTERPLGFREQFFTYGAVFENGAWRSIPLFSGASGSGFGSGQIDAGPLNAELATYIPDAVPIGSTTEHDQNIPRAKWVEVPPTDPKGYTMRYAFWVEDLSGHVDGQTVGLKPRDLGTDTSELDITTILDPTKDTGVIPPPLDAKRAEIRTSATIRQFLTKDEAKRIEPYIDYSTPSPSAVIPKVIPQGFGYADAGMAAPDLNEFVTAKDVDGIAAHIESNIPTFKNRKGGFPASEDYVKTIAASIIDYADTDTNATTGTGYRGVDSYPFVNELFDRYEWVASPLGTVSVDVNTYIELWNPSNRQASGTFTFDNINKRQLKLGGNGFKDFTTASYGPVAATIPPNGFRVFPLGKKNYLFDVGVEPAQPANFDADDEDSSFELFWNGRLVDRPRGGVQRTWSFFRTGITERQWKGNSAPPNDFTIGQPGDPRISFYTSDFFQKSDYNSNSNWGGRALREGLMDKSLPYREVRLEKWPDRGSNSTAGIAAGTDARVPTETNIIVKSTGAPVNPPRDFPSNQPELAPARISNAGEYKSLAEIGNIFDPAQWLNLEKSSASPSSKAGGGITFAVGRPEYAALDKDGQRAAQLLDLFSLRQPVPAASPPVNINTASREVIRSLIAGVTLAADPIATELGIAKKTVDPAIGDIFADQVIAYRTSRPMRSVSDFNLVREKPLEARNYDSPDDQPFFGNPKNFINVPTIPARTNPNLEYDQTIYKEWNDSGREELFRKVIDLVSYRSNVFRVVVAGEIIDSAGKRAARSVREYHISLFPLRDADGIIVPNRPLILRKFYEKIR